MLRKVSNAILFMQKLRMVQVSVDLQDSLEISMLNRIGLYEAYKENIPVNYILKWHDLGSPGTLHNRLLNLQKKEFVTLDKIDGDARVRYVRLTKKAHEYYAFLGETMLSPVKVVTEYKVPEIVEKKLR